MSHSLYQAILNSNRVTQDIYVCGAGVFLCLCAGVCVCWTLTPSLLRLRVDPTLKFRSPDVCSCI
eukprot:m.57280 g.57280  ORF g.57280 m.57280 type:complete len:65 (+) comp11594_c1_seq1:112-306(+)